eukprot:SAG31_NODE_33976_length_338_cov_0.652720_1_plen_38_part_10
MLTGHLRQYIHVLLSTYGTQSPCTPFDSAEHRLLGTAV